MKKLYFLLFTILISTASFGQTTVFINEIHYDNASSDVNEGVEIAGPAGTDLSTYTITLYNGSNGSSYDTETLSGTIPDEGGSGFGAVWFPIAGMQNGAPDGIALDNNGTLIQFLSYEGSFMASGGPADGITSTDIGVSEGGGTAVGDSLQLTGSGTTYENFTWSGPSASSAGTINTGQSFGAATPTIAITSPADMAMLPSGSTPVNLEWTTNNLSGSETVNVIVNGVTSMDQMSPFEITTTDGTTYNVEVQLVDGGLLDSDAISFTVEFPCDLVLETPIVTCDANTAGADTYTTRIDFTGGGTSNYTVDTGGIGTLDVSNGNPTVDASGYMLITSVLEGTDFTFNITGDATSSCDLTENITSPACVPSVCANPGDIIISEIMRNPGAVSDANGEYFEVYNNTGSDIDMLGWVIRDEDINSSFETPHTITLPTVVPAGGYFVFVINGDSMANGGITGAYSYNGDISLSNSGSSSDGIVIECQGSIIDQVIWDGTFPPATSGNAMELSNTLLARNNLDNDLGTNWGLVPPGFTYGDGDLGTPGSANAFALSTNDFDLNRFSMYPNPTNTGEVTISSINASPIDVKVFDILGKQVKAETITNTLDVSNLKSGIYLLNLTQDGATSTKKLVIK
ncbi:MAG: T9SS C-terminal target domain-containing protein [Winogradskyella sp.]|uniref:T9SS type A sorting domain-containing protein n=1 Tax=Winogradskyella sp. TaxID=1883156 RepID=UPI000F40C9CD|nr:T9SS type A sorting domain-containing protein [Winogradskyella sp.]RNC87780.1 MAG: T9SS C-terminal target domain-containing protein [Winogradskyella sp.]